MLKVSPTTDPRHREILRAALTGNREQMVHILANEPSSIHAVTMHGWTALHLACIHGHEDIVAQLLVMGPDLIHTADPDGWTALHFAAQSGRDRVVAQLLAASPSLVNAVTSDQNRTALHFALQYGNERVARQLIAAGAPLTVADVDGRTVLHWAVTRSYEEVAELVLAAHPEQIRAVDHLGCTMLHHAVQDCRDSFALRIWRLDPSALHLGSEEGVTPFQIAIGARKDVLVDLMQWSLSFDEIMGATVNQDVGRFLGVMEEQCDGLANSLNADVVGIVFEYIGLRGSKPINEEQQEQEEEEEEEDTDPLTAAAESDASVVSLHITEENKTNTDWT